MKRLVDLDKTAEDMKAMADKIQRQQKLFNKHDTNSSGEVERFEELKLVVDDIISKLVVVAPVSTYVTKWRC